MRATIEGTTMCCGVAEVDGLNERGRWDPKGFLELLVTNHVEDMQYNVEDAGTESLKYLCQVLFTVATGHEYPKAHGERLTRLKKYIEDNNLGSFIVTPARRNQGSGNYVRVGVWTPKTGALKEWAEEVKIEFPKKEEMTRYNYWGGRW